MTMSVHRSAVQRSVSGKGGGNKNLLCQKQPPDEAGNKGQQVSPKYIYKLENQMTWKTWTLRRAEGSTQYYGRSLNCHHLVCGPV